MRVLIALVHVPFVRRPVDDLAESLRRALREEGHPSEIIRIPFHWAPMERTIDHLVACRLIDWTKGREPGGDLLLCLEFPTYLIRHPNKVLWLAHRERSLDPAMWRRGLSEASTASLEACLEIDRGVLTEARRIYSVSTSVAFQLRKETAITAVPLYPPPPALERFYWEPEEDYFLVPDSGTGRERLDLLLMALSETSPKVRIRVCRGGMGPSRSSEGSADISIGPELADRIEWSDDPRDSDLPDLYAHCRAVVLPSREEALPAVALHSMMASKPLIACVDSGAPVELIRHRETGLLVEAEPSALAAGMQELWEEHQKARIWGAAARRLYATLGVCWSSVVRELVDPTSAVRPPRVGALTCVPAES